MACRQERKTLKDVDGNEHEYFVIQKPAREGEILKFKLLAMLGPALSNLKGLSIKDGAPDTDQALSSFGGAISALFEKNEPEQVFDFLQALVLNISRDSERVTKESFDRIYTDNSLEFYAACAFVLEVNLGNFLKGLKFDGLLGKLKALA